MRWRVAPVSPDCSRTRWRGEIERRWLAGRARWGWLLLLGVPFVSVMTVGAMLPPYLLWTPDEPHGYDVVEYHLQVPREWYEAGRIIPLHHNVFSFFPFNVEMHYLLAMHLRGGPWAGMYLATLMHGAMILLSVLAACGFARRLTRSTPQAATAPVIGSTRHAHHPLARRNSAPSPTTKAGSSSSAPLPIGWAALALRDPAHRISRFRPRWRHGRLRLRRETHRSPRSPRRNRPDLSDPHDLLPPSRAIHTSAPPCRPAGVWRGRRVRLLALAHPHLCLVWGNPVFPELAPSSDMAISAPCKSNAGNAPRASTR